MSINLATLSRGAVWLRAKDVGANGSDVTTWIDRLGNHNAISSASVPPKVITNATVLGGKAVKFRGQSVLDLGEVFKVDPNATASSTYYDSYSPSKALDENVSSDWASSTSESLPHWWQIAFSSPKTLTKYALRGSNSFNWNITEWTLRGSNDNFSTYDVLDTQTGVTWDDIDPRPVHEYSFTNTTAYLAYRLNITRTIGTDSGDSQASIGEFICGETVLGDVDMVPNSYEAWIVVKAIMEYSQPNGLWKWSDAYTYSTYPNQQGDSYYLYEGFCSSNYIYAYHPFSNSKDVNKWRVYRVTFNNGDMRIYLDGEEQASTPYATLSLTNNVQIGHARYGFSSIYNFFGEVAEVYARNKVSSAETANEILRYLQGEHIYPTVLGHAPVTIKSRYNVGIIPDLTSTAPVDVYNSDYSIQASTTDSTAPVDVKAKAQSIAELSGYPGEASEILIPMELSGAIDPLLPPPVSPVDFEGIPDPIVAPILTSSNVGDGHLLPGTYRYSYAAWKGSPSQATAPSPSADITLGSSGSHVHVWEVADFSGPGTTQPNSPAGLWKKIGIWTPTSSGIVTIPDPGDDGISSEVDYLVYPASDVAGWGVADGWGWWNGIRPVGVWESNPDPKPFVSGTTYVLAIYVWQEPPATYDSIIGQGMNYSTFIEAIQAFGNVELPQHSSVTLTYPTIEGADGYLVYREEV